MRSVTHTRDFAVPAPVDAVFPLFSAEGEKRWVPGWDYHNVMGHADPAEDYVFTTSNHDHRGANAIWLVKRYDPDAHLIELYKVEPGDKVGIVRVRCRPLESGHTQVEVTYTYRALSEAGERFIAGFDDTAYAAFMDEWRTLLARYFSAA